MNDATTDTSRSAAPSTFAYEARTADGRAVSGTLDAEEAALARDTLENMGLDVVSLMAVDDEAASSRRRARLVGEEDLLAFNEQLAQITAAGMPLERGLRLMADDLKRGRMAEALHAVADELERGRSLNEAFDAHRDRFPHLYGKLVEVGLRTNSLAGVMFAMNRHIELVRQVRWVMWEACLYPAVVQITLMLLIGMLGLFVAPSFSSIFEDFDTELPALTKFVLGWAPIVAPVALAIAAAISLGVVVAALPIRTRLHAAIGDGLYTWPLIGQVMQHQQLSRWCDAVRMGIDAGLDLPESIDLAGQSVGSPGLTQDSQKLCDALAAGQPADAVGPTRVLPRQVIVAMVMGSERNMLSAALGTLATLYQQQSQRKLIALRNVLTPTLVIITGMLVGLTILALFLPFVTITQSLT